MHFFEGGVLGGLSRRCPERPFGEYDPLGCPLTETLSIIDWRTYGAVLEVQFDTTSISRHTLLSYYHL